MDFQLTPEQKKQLYQLSLSEDTVTARECCKSFLAMTDYVETLSEKPTTIDDLFCKLLSGVSYTNEQITSFLIQRTGKISSIYVPVVFSEAADAECAGEIERILGAIPDSFLVKFEGHYILLLGSEESLAQPPELYSLIKRFGMQAATGRPCSDLSRLYKYYRQALDTLKYMRVLRSCAYICSYDQFSMIHLLDGLRDDVDLNNFSIPDIDILQKYDAENQTELCGTLLCYLENSKNAKQTADTMHIHKNSVYYRIDKCMELLPDINFNDGVMSFLMMLSLYIAQYDYYRKHRLD